MSFHFQFCFQFTISENLNQLFTIGKTSCLQFLNADLCKILCLSNLLKRRKVYSKILLMVNILESSLRYTTLITKEDFFLMIKETTYCKRSVLLFAKQSKKTKKKMEEERQDIGETNTSRQEGKKGTKGSPTKRRLIPAANYKQSVRDTFTDRESVGGDLYTMAEICQKFNYTYGRFYNLRMRYSIPCIKANSTKCFPKAEVDKAMAEEDERLGNNLSEHWYSCFDIMRLFGLGKTQVRRFALTHGVRTKRIHGNRLYYLKADWDAARKEAERKSASTKAKREE